MLRGTSTLLKQVAKLGNVVNQKISKPSIVSFINSSNRTLYTGTSGSPYTEGKHRSNAEELVNQIPVIEVDGHTAVCDGGGGALGHPIEYIQLDTISEEPAVCKYCGLRYKSKGH